MPKQHRFGDDAAQSARFGQPDYDHHQMNPKDDEITHPGNDSSTPQSLDSDSNQQFAAAFTQPPKPELPTLLETGSFYFAPTRACWISSLDLLTAWGGWRL